MRKKVNKKNKDHIRILRYFKNVKFWLFILCLLMTGYVLINIFNPIISANMITSLTNFNVNDAIIYALLFLFISIFKVIISRLTDIVFFKKIKSKLIYSIRSDMIKSIFEMKTVNFDKTSSGELTERLKNDPEDISSILSAVQYSFFNIIGDGIILIYVFCISWIIGLVYVACLLIVYFYEKRAFAIYEQIHRITSKSRDKNATLLNESMRGIRDIKALNISTPFYSLISKNLKETTDYDTDLNIKHGIIFSNLDIIKAVTTVLVIIIGIYLVDINKLNATNLLILFMYRTDIFDIVLCYTTIRDYYAKYKVAASRIFELMDDKKFTKEKFGKKELENIEGKIQIKDLNFAYDKTQVLKGINLTLQPNDTIAIVGASGSGKTTLFNLLSKSYDVEDNSIFIDDIDINDLTQDSIRNNISVITQHPYLFNLSIKDNFKLIDENIKNQEIIEACKIAQIHDYIQTLPQKYNTLIGEGGVNLSGGQRQRIAIARALIKKSKIILFDEATSALDNITQAEIQKSINNISDKCTMIIVAHRLSTVKQCNKIYVMNGGKIVGFGSHEELLENNQYYQDLYNQELI